VTYDEMMVDFARSYDEVLAALAKMPDPFAEL
jgi:hypothetical protein